MTLSQILDLIWTSEHITVAKPDGKEICEPTYRIRWHHKDILNKQVEHIVPDDGSIYITLKGE